LTIFELILEIKTVFRQTAVSNHSFFNKSFHILELFIIFVVNNIVLNENKI
jgi:hypothetical protein